MHHLRLTSVLLLVLLSAPAVADEVVHEATWNTADLGQALPDDLADPVGKTRWELEGLISSDVWARSIVELDDGSLVVNETQGGYTDGKIYGVASRDWWLPQQGSLANGATLRFSEADGGSVDELTVNTKRLGTGWAFLPSGPREVVLQRALVARGKSGIAPEQIVYRWIDPRDGVVAEAWGTPGPGGEMVELQGAATVESVTRGGVGLKAYSFEIENGPGGRLTYGYDRRGTCTSSAVPCVEDADCTGGGTDRCLIPVSEVTTIAHATIGDLINAGAWDFTPTQLADSRYEIATTTVTISPTETCNSQQCGLAGTMNMGREDKNFSDPSNAFITLSATEGEQRAGDYSIWLRGGVRNEGISGALGSGESRFCYDGTDGGGNPRPEVPLWQFQTEDANGWFFQNGDIWTHTPFACEQSLFNHVCPNTCGFFCPLYVQGCSGLPNEGTQTSVVIGEGPVTTPSGHTYNALLVRSVVDFCVYLISGCSIPTESVHQVIYLFVVPNIGTIARLMSEQDAADDTSWSQMMETDVKYGLYPPRSISSTGETETTISFSWDPGTITSHIDGYKVYWDTDSGASSAYAFDSVTNAGQISIVGTTATISGLTAGTDYYVTVTALSDYANPTAGITNTYESILLSSVIPGSSSPQPPELMVTTDSSMCTPTIEVDSETAIAMGAMGFRLDKSGSNVQFSWDDPSDPCVDGYSILQAPSPESAGNWSVFEPDTGLATSTTLNAPLGYYLVIGKGTGGTGPWGHYGM